MFPDFRKPFIGYVLESVYIVNWIAQQENSSVPITQRPESNSVLRFNIFLLSMSLQKGTTLADHSPPVRRYPTIAIHNLHRQRELLHSNCQTLLEHRSERVNLYDCYHIERFLRIILAELNWLQWTKIKLEQKLLITIGHLFHTDS